MILAGDIGGTSARLGFFETDGGRPRPVLEKNYPSRKYSGLEEIATQFVTEHPAEIDRVCFGIAGPVQGGRVTTPNLPWVVDAQNLARSLRLPGVTLINDLEANAYGIATLEPEDLVTLNHGAPGAQGNRAVIAVGTGLGQAGLFWDGRLHQPFACEGGHADFAPRTPVEADLLAHLLTRYEHVSVERVLSGPGLRVIYEFLRDSQRGEEPAWLREELAQGDVSAGISRIAGEGRSELCADALDLFVSLYGAEAGNLGLKLMATGGVYVSGGVAPKILNRLQSPLFMAAFSSKGRMRPLLESMPVQVIMKETAGLFGAARHAMLAD